MSPSAAHEPSVGALDPAVKASGDDKRPPRASLATRIAIAAIATAALLAAAWSAMTAITSAQYDTATDALNANLATAAGDDVDLSQLRASQQQVDDQFRGIERMTRLVPAPLSSAISTNADASRRLSAIVDAALNQQRDGSSGGGQQQDQSSDQTDQQNQQTNPELSDEQRQKVQDLIEQNRRLAATSSPTASSTGTPSAPSEQSSVKPW